LRIVKELYPNSTFIIYDIIEPTNINRFQEIEKFVTDSYLPLPLFGLFSNNELKLVAAGGITRENWERIVLNVTTGVNIYIANDKGEAIFEKNIGDSLEIAKLKDLFLSNVIQISNSDNISSYLIFATALVDALNPCMLGFFLIFLAFISYSSSPVIAVRTSLAFGSAVFISRMIIGLFLIQVLWISSIIKIFSVTISLLLGAIKILQYFFGENRQIPSRFADQISNYIEHATNPTTGFVAGCVTTLFITTCSSPPYFFALSLISTGSDTLRGLELLSIYNFLVVMPLFIILFSVYILNLTTTPNMRLWLSTHRKNINLIIGLGLVVMSIFWIFYQTQFLG
jgi:cytochrome c biogenesis protein CcdA